MKKLFKISKRSIAAILTLCILLGVAGTCVYAASAMTEETAVTEETTESAEETTQELVPVMASECCDHTYTNTSYSGGTCPACNKSVSGTVIRCSKCGSGWINLTCGHRFFLND